MLMEEVKKRKENLKIFIEKNKIPAILITNKRNVFYLTGKPFGNLLLTKNLELLFLDELHGKIHNEFYHQKGYAFEISLIEKDKFFKKLIAILNEGRVKTLFLDNTNSEFLRNLKRKLKVNLKTTEIVREMRAIKSEYEIFSLRKSANIAKKVMKKAYSIIREGVKETDAIAEIEAMIRKLGSEEPPFGNGALLSSGKDSAEIHPILRKGKKIKENCFVVLDLGAKINGYYSDMTRTMKISDLSTEDEKIFEFVKNLEIEIIDKVDDGIKAKELHKFAENEIKKLGYKFYHSLGHGIGLDVHELPNLSSDSKDVLSKGMVFTIEPGIYIPKKFGVRFEDMILLNKKGKAEILTKI
ncbi:MAG: Xaa-Pro peptidase family protein [Candidatus Altiarchaeota archaeon]